MVTLNYSDDPVIIHKNSIFLAGPTKRISGDFGKNKYAHTAWREEAVKILNDIGFDGILYIPELKHDKWEPRIRIRQMEWEWTALENCGCIVFWVPRCLNRDDTENYLEGYTTNIEFGRYTAERPRNVVYGRPITADKCEYMDILYERKIGRYIRTSLDLTLYDAVEIVRKIEEGSKILKDKSLDKLLQQPIEDV